LPSYFLLPLYGKFICVPDSRANQLTAVIGTVVHICFPVSRVALTAL
jgi:hypothetical protein